MPTPLERIDQTIDPAAELLSIDDLATILNVSRRTVQALRHDGKLLPPDVTWSRKLIRWRRDMVTQWLRWSCPSEENWKTFVAAAKRG
jgi:excisionase family DNA binding protein